MEQRPVEEMFRRFVRDETVTQIAELGAGHVNRTWRVETDAGAYICQRLNRGALSGAADALAYNYLRYREACESVPDWEAPRWLTTADGALFAFDGGDAWRTYPMIPGRTCDSGAELTDEAIRQFARGLCVLHFALDHFSAPPKTVIEHFHDLDFYYDEFRSVRDGARAIPEVNERIERELRGFGDVSAFRRDAVVHADTRIGNAIFGADGRMVAFIDIDTISSGCRLIDVADAARSVSCHREGDGGRFDRAAYDAFVGALAASPLCTLTAAELDAVPMFLLRVTFELGLRYYTDYLRGSVYFRVKEPEETLRRALGQFALLDEIRKAL